MELERIGPVEVETSGDIGVVTLRRVNEVLGEELVFDRTEWERFKELFKDGSFDHI